MKEGTLKEFVDNIIQERMQNAFSQMKAGKEKSSADDVEKEYQEALALLPPDKEQIVRRYCEMILEGGVENEIFFYRLGLRDGIRLEKIVKKMIRSVA